MSVKDGKGKVLSRAEDLLKRCQEQFRSIFNPPKPENTVSIPEATEDTDINTKPPSVHETKMVIIEMRKTKRLEHTA